MYELLAMGVKGLAVEQSNWEDIEIIGCVEFVEKAPGRQGLLRIRGL